jgi:hypothetical protein
MSMDPRDTVKLSIARSLVELAWDAGNMPQSFDIRYKGTDWEVVVIKGIEVGDHLGSLENDFIQELPE